MSYVGFPESSVKYKPSGFNKAYLFCAYFFCLCLGKIQELISLSFQLRNVLFDLCGSRKVLTTNSLIQDLF